MSATTSLQAASLQPSLTVRDLARSAAWYSEVFGFTIARRVEHEGKLRSVYVTAGDVRILLNQDDGAKGRERKLGDGFSMMLNVDRDVDAVAAGIKARGGKLDMEPTDMPWGARMFRVFDPDGYKYAVACPVGK